MMMIATLSATATELAAQDAQLYVDAGVSHARPPAEVAGDPATYATLGGRFVLGPTFGSAYGAQALDANSANWLGGTLGAYWRTGGIGGPGFSVTGMLIAFTLGDPTPYDAVTGRLIPEVSLPLGASTLRLRGYGGVGRSDVADYSVNPPGSVVSDLWAYGGGLEWVVPLGRAASTQAWAGGEAYDSPAGPYYAGYVGGGGALGGSQWSLRVKFWDTPAGGELELRAALAVGLTRGWTVEAAAGQAGPDPLLGSPAGIDGGLTLTWNPLARAEPPPLVSLQPGGDSSAVLIQLKLDGAQSVSVMGDFFGWKEIAMERHGDTWMAQLSLAPGVYHFGFRVDGEWYVPQDAPGRVTDEFGQLNATLIVPGP
ncbi:MAG TPA: glycogen-binding domain-containing protein [Gemmatimonadota bacterium]|nr:glycogen-binding domain-containing protein [Gemmatimonadota bacterium]